MRSQVRRTVIRKRMSPIRGTLTLFRERLTLIVSDCSSVQVRRTMKFLRMTVFLGTLYLFRERLLVIRERLAGIVTEA